MRVVLCQLLIQGRHRKAVLAEPVSGSCTLVPWDKRAQEATATSRGAPCLLEHVSSCDGTVMGVQQGIPLTREASRQILRQREASGKRVHVEGAAGI